MFKKLLLLAALIPTTSFATPTIQQQTETMVKEHLIRPDTVIFYDYNQVSILNNDYKAIIVCGVIDAKDTYDRFVGRHLYIGLFSVDVHTTTPVGVNFGTMSIAKELQDKAKIDPQNSGLQAMAQCTNKM